MQQRCFFMRILLAALSLSALLLAPAAAQDAPSLGDVARQHRQEEQTKEKTAPKKVITNDEIPSHPEEASEDNNSSDRTSEDLPAEHGKQSAEHWKEQILAQKNIVATIKAHIDKLNDSVHFVEANRYTNGVQWNQFQIRKQQEIEHEKMQLDEQQKKLDDMQEAARREGYGNAVYDPDK
jgi:hypothetical protein